MTDKRKKAKSSVLPVNIDLVRTLLGPPPLLTTENPHQYWELFEQFADAIEPKNVIEWLWLKDIVDLSWEIARLRRYRMMWIEFERNSANLEDRTR